MHELGHAIGGDGRENHFGPLDVALVGEGSSKDNLPRIEIRANEFAEEALIPAAKLDDFVARKGPLFSEVSILGFAGLHGIHPGVVVGQLQGRKGMAYSKFRPMLVRIRDTLIQSALTDGWGHTVPVTL
jgi:HTH-type transcriptional regulator/antitoxin HigA